jgi:hypothetical protein
MESRIPDQYEMGMARTMNMVMKNKFHIDMTLEQARNDLIKGMYDPGGKKLLEMQKKAGIDKTVIFGSDFGLEIGDPVIPVFENNKMYADLAKEHPDKFVALCAIDPRRRGAIKHVEQCMEEWGMRGMKMHPAAGFYPTDEILYPFYEKCADWGVPIVFHSGAQPAAPVYLDQQRPCFIAEAATRFPDTKMIIAHVAMDLWVEAVMFGKLIPNVYFDLSYHQFTYVVQGPEKFFKWIRTLIDECGVSKLLWGTDTPLPSTILSDDQYVKAFLDAYEQGLFTKEEMEMMMWRNTAEVFGIVD